MVPIRSLLVATDLSPFSLAAINHALTLRLAFGARLHLLHVLEEGRAGAGRDPDAGAKAMEALRGIAGRSAGPDAGVVCSVRSGEPAQEICRYAGEAGIDMVVMATHGRSGLRQMLIGSVAERVVRHSPVPVLTIRPPELGDAFLDERDVERELHLH